MKNIINREITYWLGELWPGKPFELPDTSIERGSYSLYCRLIKSGDDLFILKRYAPAALRGYEAEIDGYRRFGKHPILPQLIAKLPVSAGRRKAYEAILLPYYERESTSPNSLLECLAIGLNLATIFRYFALQQRIYFDLRPDCLRLDKHGALRLIDLTDLITPQQLHERNKGLPVTDRESNQIPAEGKSYQEAYEQYLLTGRGWCRVVKAVERLEPAYYQSYTLARLMLVMLGGRTLRDEKVREAITLSKKPEEGGFAGYAELIALLKQMLQRNAGRRIAIDEVRKELWQLIKPYLADESRTVGRGVPAARRRLLTLTRDKHDPVSLDVYGTLRRYWRVDRQCLK